MESVVLDTKQLNKRLRDEKLRGWSFEFEPLQQRYCLSIYDSFNPEDELVFYLHTLDPKTISHSIRHKKNGVENSIDKRHSLYMEAEKIINNYF